MVIISDHPGDELLSALADHDSEAIGSPAAEHVAACAQCTAIVGEFSTLRIALGQLPDVAPPRPLRLLSPTSDAPSTPAGLGPWIRRLFGPVMAGGAALALIGMIGTTTPFLSGAAAGDSVQHERAVAQPESSKGPAAGGVDGPALQASPGTQDSEYGTDNSAQPTPVQAPAGPSGEEALGGNVSAPLPERSLWPMLLFAGVAMMVAAVLLRWILAPRGP